MVSLNVMLVQSTTLRFDGDGQNGFHRNPIRTLSEALPRQSDGGFAWVPLFAFEGLDSLFALRHRGHDSASLIYVLTPGHLHAPVYASTRIL